MTRPSKKSKVMKRRMSLLSKRRWEVYRERMATDEDSVRRPDALTGLLERHPSNGKTESSSCSEPDVRRQQLRSGETSIFSGS